jgi:hypothetical protein
MERYFGVKGRRNLERIVAAVEASGGSILHVASPSTAPFEVRARTRYGEILDLVCYAFTANKYRQEGRPDDEHRFQVKYGSDFKRPHSIYLDPNNSRTTLMFGVHDELDVFVAVDPTAHNPTWFSSSVEFKEYDLEKAMAEGWHGWERDRQKSGRRRIGPGRFDESFRTETVIAFRTEHFLDFAQFERIASGMDPGERLLLSDNVGKKLAQPRALQRLLAWPPPLDPDQPIEHPLLRQLGLTAEELFLTLQSRFRLLAAVRGSVAEVHLGRLLRAEPLITNVEQIDLDGQPDFSITYKGKPFRIECKNVLRRSSDSFPRVDFQKTRASKSDPCSRYYDAAQFEVLAACLHPVTERWAFSFSATRDLAPHRKCVGKLSDRVVVAGSTWHARLPPLLDQL